MSAARNGPKKRGLGRGLEALLGPKAAAHAPVLEATAGDVLRSLPVDALAPGKYQPRKTMDDAKLAELAESIRAQGVIQPIVVRDLGRQQKVGTPRYEIIAGERRWRATRLAGLAEIPAVVREVDDRTVVAMALIENIQREDLNPLEEAVALQRLIDEFRMTHEQAADAVGRSRSATTNLLRLLKLAKPVQAMLLEGALEMGHARALLPLEAARQIEAAHRIAARGLSVREAETLVARLLRAPAGRRKARSDRDLARLEEEVSERLGTTVQIRPGRKGAGTILVRYSGLDHLEQLLKKLR